MRIRSTTVVGHEFTRARRGYDAAEVDAVIARVAKTLRDYEDQAEELENRIAAAETAARVARPQHAAPTTESTDAARRHATEIVQHAEEDAVARRAEIASLLEAARREAEDLRVETEQARADVEKDRSDIDALRDAAIADAAEIRAAAHHDAQAIRLAATKEAQDLLGVALEEAKSLRADVAADATELRDHLVATADAELTARRKELDSQREETDETARRTAAALASAEEERSALEARLTSLRATVQTIEGQMKTLVGDIAERAGRIGELIDVGDGEPTSTDPSQVTIDSDDQAPVESEHDEPSPDAHEQMAHPEDSPVSALPVSGFQAPAEDAPLATAEASAVFEVTEPDVDLTDLAESEDSHTYAQHDAYAEPDGSGRPPAERATIIPESITGTPAASDDHHGPYRTVYQRAGRNLRARLRQEGEDPSQRGR